MNPHETPEDIIESLTRQHTVDGYTSYPALCDSLERTLRGALAEIEQFRSRGARLADSERAAAALACGGAA
jgi:hypothetical protein